MPKTESILGRVINGLPISGVSMTEVRCECCDPECACRGVCTGLASYLWGGVDAGDWQYLCKRCGARTAERNTRPAQLRVVPAEPTKEDN